MLFWALPNLPGLTVANIIFLSLYFVILYAGLTWPRVRSRVYERNSIFLLSTSFFWLKINSVDLEVVVGKLGLRE
jgi:hypothetical protein